MAINLEYLANKPKCKSPEEEETPLKTECNVFLPVCDLNAKKDETVDDIVRFLQLRSRYELKSLTIKEMLGLTGSDSGIAYLTDNPVLLVCLINLLNDPDCYVHETAAMCLINLAANEKTAEILVYLDIDANTPAAMKPPLNIVATIIKIIRTPTSRGADSCCKILSNLSRWSQLNEKVLDMIELGGTDLMDIVAEFANLQFNKMGQTLHYLGSVFAGLSQSQRVREVILDMEEIVIQKLLPFTQYQESLVRRKGVVAAIKNCCFEEPYHDWVLGPEVNILPSLLLPLAGPEEFDYEDNDKLPIELQFLPPDKTREQDPEIRCMLLEAITQLCSKRKNREFIRDNNTYLILRELHKWEKDKKALLACENLVDILIRTEEEIGEDNLKKVDVPKELQENFKKADEEALKG